MPSKIVQQNIKELRRLRSGASERVRDIDEVIDLYSDRKIAQFRTAQKPINDLKSDNARTVNGAIRRFEKKASQWRTNEELAERMRANTKKDYAELSLLEYMARLIKEQVVMHLLTTME